MSDMTSAVAIETLRANYPDACYEQLREAVDAAIEALKAQDADSDTISRKAAIDAILAVTGNSSVRELYEHVQEHGLSDMWSGGVNAAIDIIIAVPSAQPNLQPTCNLASNDCISRQAVIEINRSYHGQMPNEVNHRIWKEINELPSAQPEKRTENTRKTHACDYINRKDAIDAHYEYCNKHPDAGFPVWSLKILEDLPSADLSGYSDRLWHNAYERGRAEALAEIVRCKDCKYYRKYGYVNGKPKFLPKCTFNSIYVNADDFCSRAERRTDED